MGAKGVDTFRVAVTGLAVLDMADGGTGALFFALVLSPLRHS